MNPVDFAETGIPVLMNPVDFAKTGIPVLMNPVDFAETGIPVLMNPVDFAETGIPVLMNCECRPYVMQCFIIVACYFSLKVQRNKKKFDMK
jgi:hypothetical protein